MLNMVEQEDRRLSPPLDDPLELSLSSVPPLADLSVEILCKMNNLLSI